jgi:MFS family permease
MGLCFSPAWRAARWPENLRSPELLAPRAGSIAVAWPRAIDQVSSMLARHAIWRDRNFVQLWLAQAVSAFGARITREGLAIAAVMGLGAAPAQTGLLAALSSGPALVIGLLSGGYVDRTSRRRLMIVSDLLRAGVLATVPVAAALHRLGMPHLYVAAALVGAASVLFQIADHAYLPTLVAREELTRANASLSATEAVAEIGGPALAGVLFQLLTAPIAVAVNAATYLVSALCLLGIRKVEAPAPAEPQTSLAGDIVAGFGVIWRTRLVRPLLLTGATQGLFGGIFSGLYILFAVRVVGLQPGQLGVTIATGGVGALAGALLAERLSRAIGAGPAIICSAAVSAFSTIFIFAAPADPRLGMASLITAQLLGDSFGVALFVLTSTLFQSRLPGEILGRAGAAFRAVGGGGAVIGAVLGGVLGQTVGARGALAFASAGLFLVPIALAASPIPRLRDLAPEAEAEAV